MIKPTKTKKGRESSLPFLKTIPPSPSPNNAGLYWKEINHHKLALSLKNTLLDHGWIVIAERIITSEDGLDMACSFGIDFPNQEENHSFSTHIGVANSNARRFSTRWYAGVEMNDVGIVLYRGKKGRKHGPKYVIGKENERFIVQCKKVFKTFTQRILTLKNSLVKESEILRSLILCGRNQLIPWSRIGEADSRCRLVKNRWELLTQLCTQIDRGPSISQMEKKHKAKRIVESASYVDLGKYEEISL